MFCAAHQVTVMASLWSTCILFCSVGSLVLPETTENEGGKKITDPGQGRSSGRFNQSKAAEGLETVARWSEKGTPDNQVYDYRTQSRCRMPDISQGGLSHSRHKRYTLHGSQHTPGSTLTYRISRYSEKLPNNLQDDIFRNATNMWAREANIKFRQVENNNIDVDINIKFVRGNQDGADFNGPGGVIGRATFPLPNAGGEQYYDEDELWTHESDQGINLFQQVTHLTGHSLGLHHSNDSSAVMFPLATPYDPNFRLGFDDIRGIQALYPLMTTSQEMVTSSNSVLESTQEMVTGANDLRPGTTTVVVAASTAAVLGVFVGSILMCLIIRFCKKRPGKSTDEGNANTDINENAMDQDPRNDGVTYIDIIYDNNHHYTPLAHKPYESLLTHGNQSEQNNGAPYDGYLTLMV